MSHKDHPHPPSDWPEIILLEAILEVERKQLYLLHQILSAVTPPNASSISTQELTMQQFDPGATGIVIQSTFTPAGATAPNPGFSVSRVDSNGFCTFTNDASDSTGLTSDVTVSTSATVGTSGTIITTVTGVFPDGTSCNLTDSAAPFTYTIGAAPVGNATGLSTTQTA